MFMLVSYVISRLLYKSGGILVHNLFWYKQQVPQKNYLVILYKTSSLIHLSWWYTFFLSLMEFSKANRKKNVSNKAPYFSFLLIFLYKWIAFLTCNMFDICCRVITINISIQWKSSYLCIRSFFFVQNSLFKAKKKNHLPPHTILVWWISIYLSADVKTPLTLLYQICI